jgi:hypothetical protein
LGLLLCCRLFLWCHRIIILLDGYQHSTVTTHTHTHTHERGARVTCTFYGTSRPRTANRETHTHTHTAPVKKIRNNSPVSNNLLAVSL